MRDEVLIEVKGICRTYPGFALGPLTIDLHAGDILGLVGRNGAGKSTFLRCVLGLDQASDGNVRFADTLPIHNGKIRTAIGYISDRPAFYEWMTVDRAIRFYASFYPNWKAGRVEELLGYLQLDRTKRIADLSTGNRLKLALLLCLCQGAHILVLDEPTSGLDPIVRDDLLRLIRQSVDEQWVKAVIFASHVLAEVSAVSTRVAVLHAGKFVDTFTMRSFAVESHVSKESHADLFSERCLEAMR